MRLKFYFPLLLVTILCLGTILPLFHNGFFEFHDNTQVVRVYEMGEMLKHKIFPVRWVADLGYGYGYPIFNFYGPFPYYIGGAIYALGLDVLLSTKIMFGVGSLVSAISMYFLSRRFFGSLGGILSATAYAYFPYHAVNIYVRGAVGEFFAYAFLPILFLGIFRLLESSKFKLNYENFISILLISMGTFLIAISHNLTLFMSLLIIFPTLVIGFLIAKSKKIFLSFSLLSLFLGLMLASFYILPAFLEMKYTNVASQVGGGADYRDHFVCLSQFWDSQWGFGGSVKGCMDGMSFKLGKINIALFVVALLGLSYSFYKRKIKLNEKLVLIFVALFLISLLLTTSFSKLIWDNIPFIAYVQYPWRFMNFIALFMSLGIGYLVVFFNIKRQGLGRIILSFVIATLVMISNYKFFLPQNYNNYSADYYLDKKYINFTISKISDEYLPKGFIAPKNILELPQNDAILESKGDLDFNQDGNIINILYTSENDNVLKINRAYYPSWRAYINGKEEIIKPVDSGISILIPKGKGEVRLRFENTPIQLTGNTLSIVAFLIIFAGIMQQAFKFVKK